MDKQAWPTGIRPSGSGIRIKLWKGGRLCYSETVAGDPYKAADLAAAIRRREYLTSRIRLGLPLIEGETRTDNETFSTLAQDYLNGLDVKRSTASDYLRILNGHWLPRFGKYLKTEITTRMIKDALSEIDVTNKTKRNLLIPLRGAFDHGDINPNPVGSIAKKAGKRRQKAKVSRYTPKERDALISELQGQPKVYFAVLFGCGLRPGEALGLTWTDYNGTHLQINKQIARRRMEPTTKTCVERSVYVPLWVRAHLNAHTTRFKGRHVFLNSIDTPCLDTDSMNAEWKRAHKALRLPVRIPYTCRHTRAAELLSTGVDPAEAAKQMGHSLEMFFRTYAELIEEFGKQKDDARFEGVPTKKRHIDEAGS